MLVIVIAMGRMKKKLPNHDELAKVSEAKWQELQVQIDSSKALAQKEREVNRQKHLAAKRAEVKKGEIHSTKGKSDVNLIVEVNSATKEELIRLRGIGEVLSARMIKYRDKLGGFYDIHQVSEVYGISDSLFLSLQKYLKVNSSTINKIHLNQAELNQLKDHPYISWKLANQIVNYRDKIKQFDSIEEVKKMYVINDSIYNKLLPYLTID